MAAAKKKRLYFEIGGVEVSVSSPDKIYFPDAGITKLEVVEYYRAIAPYALRANGDRPLVLKRYVNGIAKEAFYQKRAPPTRPEWVDTVTLRFPSGRKADEVVLHTEAQLVWAVNLGCLEMHVHPVRAADLEHPDELRIDLDPVPGVEWAQIRDVGFVAREVLTELGLVGWPKTSGSRGLHIYARVRPAWTFPEVRRCALAIAREVERRAPPGQATARWWKEERRGVFLDYNQNAKDRTMAGAWSVRPRPDARVSMPITWAELETVEPGQFTLRTVPEIMKTRADPHAEMDAAVGDLTAALALVARHEAEGEGDAAWPPHYQKGEDEPVRAQPSRRRSAMPLVEIGRAKRREDGLAGLERWKARHPAVVPHLEPADVLVDRMRGRHTEWTRVRVNLQHVPEALRPAQGALDPDYDPGAEWAGVTRGPGGAAAEIEPTTPAEEAVKALRRLPGLSAKKAEALYAALHVTSVDELEEAARAGRVRSVKGFGAKTEAKLLEGIEAARRHEGKWLSVHAAEVAQQMQQVLRDRAGRVEIAGDLRRGVEVVEALALVATGELDAMRAALAACPEVRDLAVEGARLTGRYVPAAADGEGVRKAARPKDGLPFALTTAREAAFGAAWWVSTADADHRRALERAAAARGLAISVEGLFEGGAPVAAPDEAAVGAALGVPVPPPERREGEALAATPEDLLTAADIQGAVHCHTTWSDGKQSVEEMARAAEALGLSYITITDHSVSAYYADGLTVDELRRQGDEIDEVQAKVGIRILKGVEADILQDGALDYPDKVLEQLDVVVASVHSRFRLDAAAMTERVTRAMRRPVFKIWGHPLGRLLLRRDPVGIHVDAVLDAIAESRAAIEINADPNRLDLPAEHARAARARGIPFVISVDAHSARGLEVAPFGVTVARRAGLTRADVLNTRGAADFAAAVRPAG